MTALHTKLESAALEDEFRAVTLSADKRVASGLALAAIVFIIATLQLTLALDANAAVLRQVWWIRGIVLTAAVVALVLTRRATSYEPFDRILTVWIAIWFAGIVVENALLPVALTGYVAWDVFLTFAVYCTLPLPFKRQAALAVLLSAGDLFALWRFKSPGSSVNIIDITLAYICANIVGAYVSIGIHAWRRRAFLALRHEVTARTELEAALSEVKTPQGIIPICSFCKNVRTGVGDWKEIEAYVSSHSNAQFSHGVCPSCMQLHYPQVEPR